MRLWDVDTGVQITSMEGHSPSYYGDISYSPDGSILISAGGFRGADTIRLYDAKTGELVAILDGGDDRIIGASFSPDGRLIASCSFEGPIQLWGVY